MTFLFRLLTVGFLERVELVDRNVVLTKENERLHQENAAAKAALRHAICDRDDALGLVCDLRADLHASQRQCEVLMTMTPSDLRGLGPFDQETGA